MTDQPGGARSDGAGVVVVVGASAGGVEALVGLVGRLPVGLPAAVLVVLHTGPGPRTALVRILSRSTDLPVEEATDGAPLRPGTVVVAPSDRHLLVHDGRVRLGRGARENGHRPAVDPLFRSAARWYGPHALAVVLSGALDDGSAGALALSQRGGSVLVQSPDEAGHSGMPRSTLRAVPDAIVCPLAELADRVTEEVRTLAERPPGAPPPPSEEDLLVVETDIAALEAAVLEEDSPGRPSPLACPTCHGVLFEIEEDAPLVRYRCRVGHAWSPQSLMVEQEEAVESALWMALRALEERASLHRRLASTARESGRSTLEELSSELAQEADASAGVIRELLLRTNGGLVSHDEG